jgi:ribosomal protein L3
VQNLRLLKIDAEKGVLLVHGAVPGATGSPLFVCRARKKDLV